MYYWGAAVHLLVVYHFLGFFLSSELKSNLWKGSLSTLCPDYFSSAKYATSWGYGLLTHCCNTKRWNSCTLPSQTKTTKSVSFSVFIHDFILHFPKMWPACTKNLPGLCLEYYRCFQSESRHTQDETYNGLYLPGNIADLRWKMRCNN